MNDLEVQLAAYADGELDAAAVLAVEQTIAADSRARRNVEIHREITALLRAACADEMYAGNGLRIPSRHRHSWRLPALAIAASLGALILSFAAGFRSAPQSGFLDDVAEYHSVYQHETTHLAEVPPARTDEIGRWLGGLLQRNVAAPDLRMEGLSFAGARMLVSEGQPVADLLYTREHGPPLGLCITRRDETDPHATERVQLTRRSGLRIASWERGGYAFALVGDLSADEARRVAEQAERQLGS